MKVLAMTLRRVKERGEYIESHLKSLNLDYEIIDCVDYMDYTEEEYKEMYDERAVYKNPSLLKGVIGCTLSHLKIYKKMIVDNIKSALILEDDAALPPDINTILNFIEMEIGCDEVIALSYYNNANKETVLSNHNKKHLFNSLELVYPVELNEIASTMGYVITYNVALRMIDILTPVAASSDYWGEHYDRGAFTSFRCLYPVQIKPAPFRTTIEYAFTKTIISKVAAWVRKNKIPLLFQFLERRSNKILNAKYTFRFSEDLPFNNIK